MERISENSAQLATDQRGVSKRGQTPFPRSVQAGLDLERPERPKVASQKGFAHDLS
jgi:hypothetical protein